MDIPQSYSVIGLGKSGIETALFLRKKGFSVFASESSSQISPEVIQKLENAEIDYEVGANTWNRISEAEYIVLSPGISPSSTIYQEVEKSNISFGSEIEVASWFSSTKNIIAVTGSCGKTTTVHYIDQLLREFGLNSILCGNVGTPWISVVEECDEDSVIVLELSSFQLKNIQSFRPKIAILLNLYANHLDWHPDMTDYVDSKLNFLKNMNEDDFFLYRPKDQKKYFADLPIKSKTFSLENSEEGGSENILALKAVAEIFKIPPKNIESVLENFEPLEHRLEEVGVWNGVRVVNDSKSTTMASLKWALDQFENGKVILIAGGKAKSEDFKEDLDILKKKVRAVFLIGKSAPDIQEAWKEMIPAQICSDLNEVCQKSFEISSEGNVILFSPGCASFDMFDNYLDRGKQFKSIIQSLFSKAH